MSENRSTEPATAPLDAVRVPVAKTYKMWVGGRFVRSESGATTQVQHRGAHVEIPSATRKDARDAVTAAVAGQQRWGAATPYLRAQIMYRAAEMAEHRHGVAGAADAAEVFAHWAGWCDKVGAVLGTSNDVSCGPYESVSSPTPAGVAAVVVAAGSGPGGFATAVAPALAAGCAVIAVLDAADVDTVEFCEVWATSDFPAGTLNVLTSAGAEPAATLAAHSAVNVLDVSGAGADEAADLERAAGHNLTRLRRSGDGDNPIRLLSIYTELRTNWAPLSR